MGCRQSKDQQSTIGLHHFNMLVVGYSSSGKTQLLSAIKGSHNQQKNTLQINTIAIGGIKLMIFEVSGKAEMTWKNFYPITDLLMFVIDPIDSAALHKAKLKLRELDCSIKKTAKIFVVISKIDKLFQPNDNQATSANTETELQDKRVKEIVTDIDLTSLNHETQWGQCSAETGWGVKELISKLQKFLLANGAI